MIPGTPAWDRAPVSDVLVAAGWAALGVSGSTKVMSARAIDELMLGRRLGYQVRQLTAPYRPA